MLRRMLIAGALLVCAAPLFAQEYRDAHRLGGATSFYKPPLTNAASLRRMAQRPAIAADIRTVLRDAGIPQTADAVLDVLTRVSSAGNAGSCSNAAPPDGVVVECQAPVGSTVEWMAYRPIVNGKRVPGRLEKVRWAGQRSYAAFLFRVTVSNTRYTFIVPKPCGNISLASAPEREAVAAAAPAVAPPPAPPPPAPAPPAAARAPAPPAPPPAPPAAAPVPPPPSPAAPAAAATTAKTEEYWSPFFVDVLLGDEHRNRPADPIENKPTAFTQGSGLLGFRLGAQKKFDSNWSAGAAIGYGLMFLFKENTINQNPLFVDVDVNKYFDNNWFVGGLASMWDITRSETWTPAAGGRFGIPLGHHPTHPIFFVGEGRWFFSHRTHLDTHYLAWGGLRMHF
jgi:hypothetical protein